MKKIFLILLAFLFIISCKKEINYSNLEESDIYREDFDPYQMEITNDYDAQLYYKLTGNYPDGVYCAEVEYYNSNTGTRSNYNLDVEVENGDLTVIYWANSGWLDDTHFIPENISSGECIFYSDKGYRYTIVLEEYGGCGYTNEAKLKRDLLEDIEATTCPNCGGEKYSYDDLCYSCEDEKEHTCQKCGGRKFSSFDDYCDDCEEELSEEF